MIFLLLVRNINVCKMISMKSSLGVEMGGKRRNITRKIIFIVFSILFISLGIISLYVMMNHSIGNNQEGIEGFFSEIVFRFFISLIICTTLFATYFFRERDRASIIWWISLCLCTFVIFQLLKAPFLDMKYLDMPESTTLSYLSFEQDNIYEYSVVYKLIGYTENDDIKIFNINSETYDREKEKWKPNDEVRAKVYYLPNTSVLMEFETYVGDSK